MNNLCIVQALRLRSSELKLERQLENSQAEIASFKYVPFTVHSLYGDLLYVQNNVNYLCMYTIVIVVQ